MLRDNGRAFLLAQRPVGKVYAGYWEFPGGKVEQGESTLDALCRELQEELGIDVSVATPWQVEVVDYPHSLVCLHFFKVTGWSGVLQMREQQSATPGALSDVFAFGFINLNVPASALVVVGGERYDLGGASVCW